MHARLHARSRAARLIAPAPLVAPAIWPACWACGLEVIGYDPEPGVPGFPACSLRCCLGDWLADQNGLPPAFKPPCLVIVKEGK